LTLDSFGEKPPIYTTQEEYDEEVRELARQRILLSELKAALRSAYEQLPQAIEEYEGARAERQEQWKELRRITRRINYWHGKVLSARDQRNAFDVETGALLSSLRASFKESTIPKARTWRRMSPQQQRQFLRKLTRDHRAREAAIQKLKDTRDEKRRFYVQTMVYGQATEMYWSEQQDVVIKALNEQRELYRYLKDAVSELRKEIRELTDRKGRKGRISRCRDAIAVLEDEIPRKVVEEWVGDESSTGYDIYYNSVKKVYSVRKPRKGKQIVGELVREEKKIAIAYTASIKTGGGHDKDLTVEITTVTAVKEMGRSDISEVERQLDKATEKYMYEKKWDNLMPLFEKKGIEYNGEKQVEKANLYPFVVPDYDYAHIMIERRSKFIPSRTYEDTIML
jgi:hypothetical protein